MINRSIVTVTHEECCGCKACGDVCPHNAVSFALDGEGFFYPIVNSDCINCGLCIKVCPVNNDFNGWNETDQTFIGGLDKNRERRDTASSGGMFGLLATALLAKGYVACGAGFDENLKLKHRFATSEKDVDILKKSKYLQSDCSGIYKQIKEIIKIGQRVLFVGTPCQCAALKSYLGSLTRNTIIVDFACHGVPSQDLFDKCIKYYEKLHGCKVVSYSFRHKPPKYGAPKNYLLSTLKGKGVSHVAGRYYDEPFYCGFQKYITLRPSCYQCKFARTERVSDITLADFWGIEHVSNKWDRSDYPSLVILNTERGKDIFELIKSELDFFETTKSEAIKYNGILKRAFGRIKARDFFFKDLQELPFEEVVKKHLRVKRAWLRDVYYAIPFTIRKAMLNFICKMR